MFSKLKKFGRKVATGVYNTVNKIGSVLSKTGLAAVASAPVTQNKLVAPNRSVAPTGPIGTTTQSPNATSVVTGKPVYVSPSGQQFTSTAPTNITPLSGGDIQKAIDTGQYGPTNIYSNSRGNAGNSVIDFGPANVPSTLTSASLAGGSSGGSTTIP